jgi:hypothetical protein
MSTHSSDVVARAVRAAHTGRRVLVLSGATSDWKVDGDNALRLPEFIATIAAQLNLPTVVYRRSADPELLVPRSAAHLQPPSLPRASLPHEALAELARLVESDATPVAIVVLGIENLLPDAHTPMSAPEDLDLLDLVQRIPQSTGYSFGHSLLVLVEQAAPVHQRLRQSPGFMQVEVPMPSTEERSAFLRLISDLPEEGIAELAVATGGLTLEENRFMAATAVSPQGEPLGAVAMRRKAELLRESCPNLELLETPHGLNGLAGHQRFKQHVQASIERGRPPRMVLLVGPPGTGKSVGAKALAHALQRPMLRLEIMSSPYIGENERRLRVAQSRIDSMGGVLVWIDEIDNQFSSRSGGQQADSGAAARVTASFMEWTGDAARRDMTVAAATNRPDRLDNALDDRVSLVVPFLHAATNDLPSLVRAIAEQGEHQLAPTIDLEEVALHPNLRAVSGRQLHNVLEAASLRAYQRGVPGIDTDDLREAVSAISSRNPEQDNYWTLLALHYTSDEGLLPWSGMSCVDEGSVPYYARPFVNGDGSLDRHALARQIEVFRRQFP